MAVLRRIRAPEPSEHDGVSDRLTRLVQLEVEPGLAETRHRLISALVAVAAAIPAAIASIAS
jgi:hypothetical protein